MNVNILFIMIHIDKFIERLFSRCESLIESQYLNDLSDYMYDCLINFNSIKTVKLDKFGEYLVQCSLSTQYYTHCSRFNQLFKSKCSKLLKKGKN